MASSNKAPSRAAAAPARRDERRAPAQPAQRAPAPREEPRRAAVPAVQKANLPAAVAAAAARHAGKGVSTRAEDNLVPLIYVLQPLSPQVQDRNPNYIDGARAGDIWLRNSSEPIVNGEEEGFLFQPCTFSRCVIEWVNRDSGGGFVNRYKCEADESIEQCLRRNGVDFETRRAKKGNKTTYHNKANGNDLIETREHVGFVLERGAPMPYVIPFSSSGHTVSRGWMFDMNSHLIPGSNDKAPSFALVYRIKTKYRTNDQGTWYVLDPQFEKWAETEDDIERGATLHDAFASGAKDVEAYADTGGGQEDGGADAAQEAENAGI